MRVSVIVMAALMLLPAAPAVAQQKSKPKDAPRMTTRMLPGSALIVKINVTAMTRTWYGGRNPDLNVTKDDVKIIIDSSRTLPALRVEPEKDAPGHYVVSFSPPPDLRNRKTYDVEITIKQTSMKTKMAF